jgi:hypothetical protein
MTTAEFLNLLYRKLGDQVVDPGAEIFVRSINKEIVDQTTMVVKVGGEIFTIKVSKA